MGGSRREEFSSLHSHVKMTFHELWEWSEVIIPSKDNSSQDSTGLNESWKMFG